MRTVVVVAKPRQLGVGPKPRDQTVSFHHILTFKKGKLTTSVSRAIDKLPRTLASWGKSIMQQGWHVSILAGGPSPDNGGMTDYFVF